MQNSETLIAGFTNYVDLRELDTDGMGTREGAPGTSPVCVFSIASSAECAWFTGGLITGGIGGLAGTNALGC